jgi:hypothetical protein
MDYRDTLEGIELAGGLTASHDRATRFMVDTCRQIRLTGQAAEALEVAERYVSSRASARDLEGARVACWQSIKGRDTDLADPEVASTRAVLCTLGSREEDDDLFETLNAFEDFAIAAGIAGEALLTSLRHAFGVAAQPAVAADGATPRR